MASITRRRPELARRLWDLSNTPLAGHGITSEPASWQPPAFLLDDLDLPGPDPSRQQPGQIHELITRQRLSVRAAARNLGTTIDWGTPSLHARVPGL